MITLQQLASNLQTKLNTNTNGLTFAIFSDADKFKKPLRDVYGLTPNDPTYYVNGIMSIYDSAIVPLQNVTIASQTVDLDFVYPLKENEEYSPQLQLIRSTLDSFFVTPQAFTLDGYSVSLTSSVANTGTIDIRQRTGESITFSVTLYYTFVQGGINSTAISLSLNGQALPYTSLSITRKSITENGVYSDTNGVVKNKKVSSVLSIDLNTPALSNELYGLFNDFVYSAINNVMALIITDNSFTVPKQTTYQVIFDNQTISLEGVQNAGIKLTLIEARV